MLGGKTAQTKMESPQFGTMYRDINAQSEQYKNIWEQFVKFGGLIYKI